MKKPLKRIGTALISILAVTALTIGGYKIMKQIEHDEMVKVVKSEEADKIYKDDLQNIDRNAFTEKGIIKSYNIASFEHNPMGGIIVYLNINSNKNYHVSVFLHKDSQTGKFESGGGSWSKELEQLVKEGGK